MSVLEEIPMGERGPPNIPEDYPSRPSYVEEETSFIDDGDNYQNINIEGVPDVPEFDPEVNWARRGGFVQEKVREKPGEKPKVSEVVKNARNFESYQKVQRLKISLRRKKFFKDNFNQSVVMNDGGKKGGASRELIEKSLISINPKTGNEDGIMFEGKKVVVRKGKGFVLSTNKNIAKTVLKFETLMEDAREEHEKTANATIEEKIGSLPGTAAVNEIRYAVSNDMLDEITMMMDDLESLDLSSIQNEAESTRLDGGESSKYYDGDEILRELAGILDPKGKNNAKKLEAVEVNRPLYIDMLKDEKDPRMKELIRSVLKVITLKADQLRLEQNIAPQEEETIQRLDEHALTRFEKFKVWSKENMLGLSAVTITIAGIITTIVMGLGKGVATVAKATGALAVGLAKIAKALGPVLAPLLSILITALTWGAKGLAFLAKNLWLLAVGLSYIMYKEYKERNK